MLTYGIQKRNGGDYPQIAPQKNINNQWRPITNHFQIITRRFQDSLTVGTGILTVGTSILSPFYQSRVLTFKFNILGEMRDKILKWIDPVGIDPGKNHYAATKLSHPGTGQWFLASTEYTTWCASGPSILWIHAIRKYSPIYLLICFWC